MACCRGSWHVVEGTWCVVWDIVGVHGTLCHHLRCIVVGCIVDINVTLLMYCAYLLFYR